MNILRSIAQKLLFWRRRAPIDGSATARRVLSFDGMTILIVQTTDTPSRTKIMQSKDGFDFQPSSQAISYDLDQLPCAAIAPDPRHAGHKLMYFGDRTVKLATSTDGHHWHPVEQDLGLHTRSYPLEVGGVFAYAHSIIILYYEKEMIKGKVLYRAYFAAFDRNNPSHLLWKLDKPVWDSTQEWQGRDIISLGAVQIGEQIISYWYVDGEVVYGVVMTGVKFALSSLLSPQNMLDKHPNNPLISPHETNAWETFTTFNPAACLIDDKVHILYRAQGFDYISSLGYAVSYDGINIHERYDKPVYQPRAHFEQNDTGKADFEFVSGGGYGGCEDPRMTVIDDRVYVVYVAFDGNSPPRLAMTWITIDDFLAHRWNWSKPVLISPPGVVDKSGCILPEKVNGKYVVFHRIFPNILIDYVDDLNFDGEKRFLQGEYSINIRPKMWDSRKIGAGAPPVKTDKGWLLIYYGVDDLDASKYHIGAMLLDLKDPTVVLARCAYPILQPQQEYEMNGFKPGIAYPCGAVIIKDQLFVYYGAADSHVCVATAPLDRFLEDLTTDQKVRMDSVEIKKVSIP